MRTRPNARASVVLDGRVLAGLVERPWMPDGPVPTVFEFAHACGRTGALVDAAGIRLAVRLVAVLYMGGRIFAAPGEGPARFGVLMRARRRPVPGTYDLDIDGGGLAYLRDIPITVLPPARARSFGGNLVFLVG